MSERTPYDRWIDLASVIPGTRVWGAIVNAHGVAGAKVSVGNITSEVQHYNPQTVTTCADFWFRDCEDVRQTHMAGELHMFLMADTEWEAMEIASAGFCDHAGVWNVSGLLAWSTQQYRDWRVMRDAEIAEAKRTHEIPTIQQISLF